MSDGDIDRAEMAALIGQADPGPRAPAPAEPGESLIDRARRAADVQRAHAFTTLSEPNPFEHRAPPPERPALKPRPQPRVALALGGPWQLYGKIGALPQEQAGAHLVSAWGAFAAARTRLKASTDEQERATALDVYMEAGDDLHGHLGQAFAEVPAEEQAAYFGAWWRVRTAASADVWMEAWEEWRRQPRALALPAPQNSKPLTPPGSPGVPTLRTPARVVEVKSATPRTATRTVAPASNDERIAALFHEGLSQREIAPRVGVSQKTVSRRIVAMGLTYE